MARLPDWTQIRYVGGSLPARLTILFPLVANILIFNSAIVSQFSGEGVLFRGIPDLREQFDLYIWYTFTGLLIFSFGEICFTLFCPSIVRRYVDVDNFVLSLGPNTVSKALLLRWAREAEASAYISNEEKSQEGIDSAISIIEGRPLSLPGMNEQLINVARLYYRSRSLLFPIARAVCSVSFVIGLILMFITTIKTVIKAAKIAFPYFY
jgi:hypothetical protein